MTYALLSGFQVASILLITTPPKCWVFYKFIHAERVSDNLKNAKYIKYSLKIDLSTISRQNYYDYSQTWDSLLFYCYAVNPFPHTVTDM